MGRALQGRIDHLGSPRLVIDVATSQIEYAEAVSVRDAVGDAAYAASPAGPIYVALPIKHGLKKIAEKITESPLDRLIKEAGNSKACQR